MLHDAVNICYHVSTTYAIVILWSAIHYTKDAEPCKLLSAHPALAAARVYPLLRSLQCLTHRQGVSEAGLAAASVTPSVS